MKESRARKRVTSEREGPDGVVVVKMVLRNVVVKRMKREKGKKGDRLTDEIRKELQLWWSLVPRYFGT